MRTNEADRITGIPGKTLHRLANAGLIQRAAVTPNIVFWWPGEIEALIEPVADDVNFARSVCFRADLAQSALSPPSASYTLKAPKP